MHRKQKQIAPHLLYFFLAIRTTRTVEPRQIKQINRPFETVAGRSDIAVGYATVEVLDGEEVVVYASVVDNGTNDPTTIPMKRGTGELRTTVAAAARGDPEACESDHQLLRIACGPGAALPP